MDGPACPPQRHSILDDLYLKLQETEEELHNTEVKKERVEQRLNGFATPENSVKQAILRLEGKKAKVLEDKAQRLQAQREELVQEAQRIEREKKRIEETRKRKELEREQKRERQREKQLKREHSQREKREQKAQTQLKVTAVVNDNVEHGKEGDELKRKEIGDQEKKEEQQRVLKRAKSEQVKKKEVDEPQRHVNRAKSEDRKRPEKVVRPPLTDSPKVDDVVSETGDSKREKAKEAPTKSELEKDEKREKQSEKQAKSERNSDMNEDKSSKLEQKTSKVTEEVASKKEESDKDQALEKQVDKPSKRAEKRVEKDEMEETAPEQETNEQEPKQEKQRSVKRAKSDRRKKEEKETRKNEDNDRRNKDDKVSKPDAKSSKAVEETPKSEKREKQTEKQAKRGGKRDPLQKESEKDQKRKKQKDKQKEKQDKRGGKNRKDSKDDDAQATEDFLDSLLDDDVDMSEGDGDNQVKSSRSELMDAVKQSKEIEEDIQNILADVDHLDDDDDLPEELDDSDWVGIMGSRMSEKMPSVRSLVQSETSVDTEVEEKINANSQRNEDVFNVSNHLCNTLKMNDQLEQELADFDVLSDIDSEDEPDNAWFSLEHFLGTKKTNKAKKSADSSLRPRRGGDSSLRQSIAAFSSMISPQRKNKPKLQVKEIQESMHSFLSSSSSDLEIDATKKKKKKKRGKKKSRSKHKRKKQRLKEDDPANSEPPPSPQRSLMKQFTTRFQHADGSKAGQQSKPKRKRARATPAMDTEGEGDMSSDGEDKRKKQVGFESDSSIEDLAPQNRGIMRQFTTRFAFGAKPNAAKKSKKSRGRKKKKTRSKHNKKVEKPLSDPSLDFSLNSAGEFASDDASIPMVPLTVQAKPKTTKKKRPKSGKRSKSPKPRSGKSANKASGDNMDDSTVRMTDDSNRSSNRTANRIANKSKGDAKKGVFIKPKTENSDNTDKQANKKAVRIKKHDELILPSTSPVPEKKEAPSTFFKLPIFGLRFKKAARASPNKEFLSQ